jgi:hypothetical protein
MALLHSPNAPYVTDELPQVGPVTGVFADGFDSMQPTELTRPVIPVSPPREQQQLEREMIAARRLVAEGTERGTLVAKGTDGTEILHGHADLTDVAVGYYDPITGDLIPVAPDLSTETGARDAYPGRLELAHIALESSNVLPADLRKEIKDYFGDMPGVKLLLKHNAPPEAIEHALANVALSDDWVVAELAKMLQDRIRAFGNEMMRDML